ncbi:TOTE conflict system archaeo-eukaryotic primase domain-containing protein [Pseudobutyrivibrio xylanivorans]|uniref:Reverse transcriptase (RNA-dependent DNA polymerase) n=1 Tax=Pseudobutyrivibrio xylanivorans DSM 14809 TaxID=1123012 RepID=A0A1M6KP83_PSEXY|nr:reverse transcriptase domain-containing protein [Pseudobutyrivibrio xylanivorans]SHJ60740.1 Reverse transcriptase (RNA-dependent DNA polymerase) [Pseudobutyrivibrio xylanivorans DSM 14809]
MQAEINTLSGDSNKAVRDNLVKEIAKKEFQLFVVNTHAVAVQGENGKYYTKYIPLTPYVLENMIRNNGSIGCYQHAFHSNYIRWICMDFDCLKGKPIDLYGLYEECVRPVAIYLKERNIRFLLEFSGRRGIHVWIIFDRMISKQTGFTIINKILSDVPEVSYLINSGQWGLDKFPANGSYRKNIVGKQVKFPLSTHMNGGRSYFFEDSFAEKFDTESEEFCSEQLRIISDYVPESEGEICKKLGIEENNEVNCTLYKKYNLISSYTASADEMISILSETEVYRRIFERMRLGQTQQYDWLVVLGTFCCFDTCVDILKSIFETYPYYDAEITIDNIRKFKDKYFPATFNYLYEIYGLEIEDGIDENKTGVDYLADRLNFDIGLKERFNVNENLCVSDYNNIVSKELDYLKQNDEVISVMLVNKMNNIRKTELTKISEFAQEIKEKGCVEKITNSFLKFTVYSRLEKNDRIRNLVSLDSFNRILTTQLVLELAKEIQCKWNSYSYQISLLNKANLFYPWYSSWKRFIDQIKVYLDLPFFSNNYVVYIDLKHCYENIDILNIYREYKMSISDKGRNIFEYLCNYNDELMKSIKNGDRIGVPQGPAYARILTEIYLDRVIRDILADAELKVNFDNVELLKESYDNVQLFRYVDDIVIIAEDESVANKMYKSLCQGFVKRGLPVNMDKSKNYGMISKLSIDDRNELLHCNQFNYELMDKYSEAICLNDEKRVKMNKYLKSNPFRMELLGYYYSKYSFSIVKKHCFIGFGSKIMASREGRGKYFREFYKWLLSDSENVQYAIRKEWFKLIPVNSINFSNFVSTMYFMTQSKELAVDDIKLLLLYFLNDDFDYKKLSEEDRIVIEALKNKFPI